jgi:hypothetical protein
MALASTSGRFASRYRLLVQGTTRVRVKNSVCRSHLNGWPSSWVMPWAGTGQAHQGSSVAAVLAGRVAAEQGQVEDMRRAVEIQRRAGVQFVVQGGALRVHGWSGLVL